MLSFTCESRTRRCDPLESDWRDASAARALAELGWSAARYRPAECCSARPRPIREMRHPADRRRAMERRRSAPRIVGLDLAARMGMRRGSPGCAL